jgi:hypothetical protein
MPASRGRYSSQEQEEPSGGDNPLGIPDLEEYTPPAQNIGVPDDYTARTDISEYTDIFGDPWGGGGTVSRRPQYQEGDELLPANFGPAQIADLQRQLAEVGLLPPGASIQFRVWDETSAAAFYKLLAYANQNGLHWTSALNKMKSESQGAFQVDEFGNIVPVDPNAQEKLPTRTTPREELIPLFRQAIIETRGEGWSEDKINSMVSAFQQQEIAAQQEAYAAEGTSQNVEGMPSPEAFILSKVEGEDPDRVAAEKGLDYVNEFQQLLSQWGPGGGLF